MLVDNKFLFISLPRCASTSFFITCIRNNINTKHCGDYFDNYINSNLVKFQSIENNDNLADILGHPHEPIKMLESKFGNEYEIISVRRNKYERFISLWKHLLDEIYRMGEISIYEKFIKLNIDDILFFTKYDLVNKNDINKQVKKFLKNNKIKTNSKKILNIISIVFTPYSVYHNNDSRIIWFDFNQLHKLEEWVSIKINKNFVLEKSNSSKNFNCNIELNDYFIKKYDSIYETYDEYKNIKTLI
jgi:hypothetical protein